ncbi:MAG: deoxyribonuclease IV [Candidatus Krumholzibacteriota bacterium]|nr:deoxyribonuclease IV [Candidatus Krumholzibacteriota bacterium]
MNLGAHMSISGGVHLSLERGKSIGCNAVQLFVKSSNQWKAKPLSEEDIMLFRKNAEEYNTEYIMTHTSYLINIASPEKELLEKSRGALQIEIERSEALGIPWVVLHPGSHRGAGEEAGIKSIAESLNIIFDNTREFKSAVLLENTAGQGNTLGRSFEQLAAMMELVEDKNRIGICFDTCHALASGYDLSTKTKYDALFKSFDKILGLGNLRAFHLNDSVGPIGSHKDRHAGIGQGELGLEPFRFLVNDGRFSNIPMVLETPKGPDLKEDVENLAILRALRK